MPLKNPLQYSKTNPLLYHQKTYQEIIAHLDSNWRTSPHSIIQKINLALGDLASKLTTIFIAGTNEKNTTIHYLEEILHAKNITVGSFCSPHFTSYNERLKINGKSISKDEFVALANKILHLTQELQLPASSKDILTAMALMLFDEKKVTLSVFQQDNYTDKDPVTICTPIILGIPHIIETTPEKTLTAINAIIDSISDKTHVISADQNKSSLKKMAQRTKEINSVWVMPIRKVAPLSYPFEQLFGRYAALADRIAQTYLDHHTTQSPSMKNSSAQFDPAIQTTFQSNPCEQSLEVPLQQKKLKNLQLSSVDFWLSINNDIPNKFETITKNQTTILLDSADNIDSFNNLFLGVRLLNYQHKFDNVSFVVGCIKEACKQEDFIKLLKSYFKKQIKVIGACPTPYTIGEKIGPSWNIEHFVDVAQQAKFTAIQKPDLKTTLLEMLHQGKEHKESFLEQTHPQKNLIVITGSQSIITEYHKIHNDLQTSEQI